jgi:hypothetical protein
MEIHLNFIGIILIFLALVHCIFPKYFNWSIELKSLSLINKQMMQVHTFFIALTVFLMGILCICFSWDLTHTKFGKAISFGIGLFWGIRLFFQLFVYSPKLWKGKKLETAIHIVFVFLWTYISTIFFIVYMD